METLIKAFENLENLIYKILVWIVLIPKTLLQIVLHPDFAPDYIKQELKPEKEGGGNSRFDEYFSPILLLLIVALLPFVIWNFLPIPGVVITSPSTDNPIQDRTVNLDAEIKFISTSTDGFITTFWSVEKEFYGPDENGEYRYSYPVVQQKRYTNNPEEINSTYYFNYSQIDSHTIQDFDSFQFPEAGNYWVVVVASKFDANRNQIESYTSDVQIYVPSEDSQSTVSVYAKTKPEDGNGLWKNITGQLQNERTIFLALGLLMPPLLFALVIKLFSKDPLSEDSLKETFYVQCYYFAPIAFIFWGTRYAVQFFTPDVFFRYDTDANLILLLPMILALFWFMSVQTREISEEGKIGGGLAFVIVIVCMFVLVLGILFVAFNDDPVVQDLVRKSSIWLYPLLAVGLLVAYQILAMLGERRKNLTIPRWDKVLMGGTISIVFICMLLMAVMGRQVSLTSEQFDATQQSYAELAMNDLTTFEEQKFYTEEFDEGTLENLNDWTDPFMTNGEASQVMLSLGNDSLNFQLSELEGQAPDAYLMNTAFLYTDVRVETTTVNKVDNPYTVSLLCRVSDNGWYEFEIGSDGFYAIYAYDAGNNTYNTLASESSPAINTGLSENTFIATCQGNKLSLIINDASANPDPVASVQDTTFNYTEGTIGIGVYSPDGSQVDVDFEYIKMSAPPPSGPEVLGLSTETAPSTDGISTGEALTETPLPEAERFFTEDFDTIENWSYFVVDGDSQQISQEDNPGLSLFNDDNNLTFDLSAMNLWVYATYDQFEYDNVRIAMQADNRGANTNNVSLICRYTGSSWYEFNVSNGGLYWILYAEVDSEDKVSYETLFEGGSAAIKSGVGTNEYEAVCDGNTLSLYINGQEARVFTETKYNLASGKVGVSVSSFDVLPILIDVDWFEISQP